MAGQRGFSLSLERVNCARAAASASCFLMKAGLMFCDSCARVSPLYAAENIYHIYHEQGWRALAHHLPCQLYLHPLTPLPYLICRAHPRMERAKSRTAAGWQKRWLRGKDTGRSGIPGGKALSWSAAAPLAAASFCSKPRPRTAVTECSQVR
ncbi:hypothetical protein NDU88_002869 [Pleurodeles waltl]|uniref:Uncharacterized protein n=1 Tax=Pleurodeles waltl TaxID=8319 RepID=A0AAV7T3I5_PLEWA|nr:hypothetical protein NDU88_002869 [Pleurodeles waltl]